MKRFSNIVCVALLGVAMLFSVGCSKDEGVDNREQNYGYAQFKLYKRASYSAGESAEASTRAVQSTLDYLSQAYKVKVTLVYDNITLSQTLTLSSSDAESAEYGLRSSRLKLLTGEYNLISFTLYDAEDEVVYNGQTALNNTEAATRLGRAVIHHLILGIIEGE